MGPQAPSVGHPSTNASAMELRWMCQRNPAPVGRWFIHVYPIIHRVSTIQGDAGFLPFTVPPVNMD